MPTINFDALSAYKSIRWTLIPLHRFDAVSKDKRGRTRKDGKRPLDGNWTVRDYSTARTLAGAEKHGNNVGVRLKDDQLVIDIDPRNGGTEGFRLLCEDVGLEPSDYPTCITGSGGLHLYMSKPADLPVLDTLKDYPGVEFKSRGRQVVAAGSIHPDTGAEYAWDALTPPLADLPEAPEQLLLFIKRPQRAKELKGGGQATQEQIANALSYLNAEDYRDHADWLRLMMACHHASNGDARHEWIEFSTSDPQYAEDSEIIGRRWDSLHTERPGGEEVVSYLTLNRELRERGSTGAINAQIRDGSSIAGDFDELASEAEEDMDFESATEEKVKSKLPGGKNIDEEDGVREENPGSLSDESLAVLNKLNDTYCSVVEGGKFRIIYKEHDPVLQRDFFVRMVPADFEKQWSNVRIERDTEGLSRNAAATTTAGKAWIEHPGRRHARGVIFDPSGKEHAGWLNMWDGFATQQSRHGTWDYLKELIFEVLADGDPRVADYVMNWLRFMMQKPHIRAEVAMVFRGGKGVGKGTLGNCVARLIGRHAMAIASSDLISGRFNAHLQDVIFLFADEALKPYDKVGESRMKAMITEPRLAFEGKGRDAVTGVNYLHIMMASNEAWVIPAGFDERRFMMTDPNTKWQKDSARFDKLHAELDAGGYERFMFDLLNTSALPDGWHPRNFPVTAALVDQKVRNMAPLESFIFNALVERACPFAVIKGNWETGPIRLFVTEFRQQFQTWCRENSITPGGMGRSQSRNLMQELQLLFPAVRTGLREKVPDEWRDVITASPSDGRGEALEIPSLDDCRAEINRRAGGDAFNLVKRSFDFG